MKSIILSVAVIAAIVLSCCFYSCNKNEDAIATTEIPETNSDLKLLTDQLEVYNNDFFKDHKNSLVGTKGHNFAWWVGCAVADLSGAVGGSKVGAALLNPQAAALGALVGSVAGSAVYAWAVDQKPIEPDPNQVINTKIYHLENEYNYIGESHNEILSQLLRNKDRYVKNGIIDYDLVFNDVIIKCKPYATGNDIYYVQKYRRQIIDFNKKFVALNANCEDEVNFVNRAFDQMVIEYPEAKEDLQITRNYMLNATKITDIKELEAYANGYEKIIAQSKIKPEIKSDLLGTMSVGKNSQAFWMSANN